jgi:hypothetical protein
MLENAPRMMNWIALALLAVICWWSADNLFEPPINLIPGLFAFVFALAGAVSCTDWMLYKVSQRVRSIYDSRAVTERVKLIQALSVLNDNQLKALENTSVQVSVMGGQPGPIYSLKVGSENITFDFVREFINMGDDDYLCPVSLWAEGSKKREWAQALTAYFISFGFATRHNGNKAAKWTNKPGALAWIGMD